MSRVFATLPIASLPPYRRLFSVRSLSWSPPSLRSLGSAAPTTRIKHTSTLHSSGNSYSYSCISTSRCIIVTRNGGSFTNKYNNRRLLTPSTSASASTQLRLSQLSSHFSAMSTNEEDVPMAAAEEGETSADATSTSSSSSSSQPDSKKKRESCWNGDVDESFLSALPPGSFGVVKEGSASILFQNKNEVFYNPVQETNRDMTIAAIRHFQSTRATDPRLNRTARLRVQSRPKITILEALAATGLRSIRYAKELENVHKITVNDIEEPAVAAINRNVLFNKVDPTLCVGHHGDAVDVMYAHRRHININPKARTRTNKTKNGNNDGTTTAAAAAAADPDAAASDAAFDVYAENAMDRFDVVDIDPYGSPAPFLDSCVQSVTDGGLLCVTATDSGVLCGNNPEVTLAKYGGLAMKGKFCKEMAVRLVLQSLESTANRYERFIVPVVGMHIDFYIRVFVRVYSSAQKVRASPSKQALVYHCTSCSSFHLQHMGKATVPAPKTYKRRQKGTKAPGGADAAGDDATAAASGDGGGGGAAVSGGNARSKEVRDAEKGEKEKALEEEEEELTATLTRDQIVDHPQVKFRPSYGPPVPQRCADCGGRFQLGGPIWSDPIYDPVAAAAILENVSEHPEMYGAGDRVSALLRSQLDELPDVPLFYDVARLTQVVKVNSLPMEKIRYALRNAGYRVGGSHSNPLALKTDAPSTFVWDIMRAWQRKEDKHTHSLKENSAAYRLLNPERPNMTGTEVDFSCDDETDTSSRRRDKGPRFLPNPRDYWGPGSRAGKKRKADESDVATDAPSDNCEGGETGSAKKVKPNPDVTEQ